MKLFAPLDRRELTLIALSLTIFFIAYNVDNTIRFFGYDPEVTHGVVFSALGLGTSTHVGKDGLKLPGWRDALEEEVFGGWRWDEGHVAGDGAERAQSVGVDRHGAVWLGRDAVGELRNKHLGETTVGQAFLKWQDDLPVSKLLKHVPGYTILDNVFMFNGTVFIVTDEPVLFPPIETIVSAWGPGLNQWVVVSTEEGRKLLGKFGGFIRGVTWMSADTTPHNSTLLALWRTYSSLDRSISSSGHTTLSPPHRLFFPQNRVFPDPNPLPHFHWIRRLRVDTGFHPYIVKAAFPSLTVMYLEDWEDYHKLEVPFLLERIVVADREAAEIGMSASEDGQQAQGDLPLYWRAFEELEASEFWFEPIRTTLTAYFGEQIEGGNGDGEGWGLKKHRKAVTYLHRQGEKDGVKLADEDHRALIKALRDLGKHAGYEVNIVSSQTAETEWNEKMEAIIRSDLVIGVTGDELLDGIFMRMTPLATMVELFPVDTFVRDREVIARSRKIRYHGWWFDRPLSPDSLPPVVRPVDQVMHIDWKALAKTVRTLLSR